MTNFDGIITGFISETVAPGLAVYDLDGTEVGSVDSVDRKTGWFTVGVSASSDKQLYIPFSLITSIDPHDMFLPRSGDDMRTDYANPPGRRRRAGQDQRAEDVDRHGQPCLWRRYAGPGQDQ